MRERTVDTVRSARVAVAVIVVSAIVAAAGIGAAIWLRIHDENSLRAALIVNCEENGNPLREAEIEDLREGITSIHDPRIKILFPDVPAAVAVEIISEQNARHRARIQKIQPVDCSAQYPKP